ncbi:ras-related protein Rab-38 isoform X2 [Phlebotomus papatasi]|uniref:ras-related protein Rab-38 isoform X2 n=1 Tax=Phlebotomus papatasi TaxID=29031 RepID=UPI0024833BA7|nr:ras-related protein Rab-38 isoform X2 [Phlebotomus papatasi]
MGSGVIATVSTRYRKSRHQHVSHRHSPSEPQNFHRTSHREHPREVLLCRRHTLSVTNMTPSGQTSGGKKEHLYKILVIGELGTGKTSFIKRYVHQFFSNNYRATIGVDFALKVIPWDENTIVRLQLWDIAGQERFGNMTRVYYKEAVGAFIVFDVTRSATFDAVAKWKQDLDAKVQLPDGSNIPCVLLANKCDQEKQGFVCNSAKMDEYVRENKFTAWFETSAKENINIEESAKALVTKILINDKTIVADPADDEKVMLTNSTHSTSKSCAC